MKVKYKSIEKGLTPHTVAILTCTLDEINNNFKKIPPKGFSTHSNGNINNKPYTFIFDSCYSYGLNLVHKIDGYISKFLYNSYLSNGIDEGVSIPNVQSNSHLSSILLDIISNPNPKLDSWTSLFSIDENDLEYDYEDDIYIDDDITEDDDIDYENDDRYEDVTHELTEEELEEIYDNLYEDI